MNENQAIKYTWDREEREEEEKNQFNYRGSRQRDCKWGGTIKMDT